MITWDRTKTISALAFPVFISVSLTLAMSLVDLAFVKRLGNHTSAAVGLAVFSNILVLAFVGGIAPAVQGIVARRRGQGSKEPRCLPLNAGLLTALVVGVPLTILCYFFTPFLVSLLSSDPAVVKVAVPFLRTLYTGVTAVGMVCAFKGYWYAIEKPNVNLVIVLFVQCLNFAGDYTLISGRFGLPALGATGAAVSTATALWVGVIINFVLIYWRDRKEGFLTAKPGRALMVRILKLGIPATMQEFLFALGYLVFFWMIGKIGTAELAAANVLVRISMVLVLMAMGLGTASATLVSKNVGAGDPAGAAEWGWDAGKLGVIGITLLGLPLFLFPERVLSVFLMHPHTIAMAVIPLRMVAATTGLGSLIYIFAYTLFSVGDGNRVILVSFGTQWIIFLPAVWIVGPWLRYGLLQIWLVQMVYGAIATVLITAIWAQGRWKSVKI